MGNAMKTTLLPALLLITAVASSSCSTCPNCDTSGDPLLHVNDRSYLDGYDARLEDGSINVVVEIPAGSTAKWEVTKPEGELRWEIRDGKPRVVRYLGYPGNYGMIPRTLLPKELGGDGDPLDVIVLGTSVARGTMVPARLIGVMHMLDGGEQDDKLLAVRPGTPFGEVYDLAELEAQFPGVMTILETWFARYKGPGKVVVPGFSDVPEALEILEAATEAYQPPEHE